VVEHLPLHASAVDQVVHPVQAPKNGGLAGSGRTDQRCDLLPPDREDHVTDREVAAVPDTEARDVEDHSVVVPCLGRLLHL
jgi:hypothetical protein